MAFLKGLSILLGFLVLGQHISEGFHLPVPGAVLGMLLLWTALHLGWIKLQWVEQACTSLLSLLGLLFVPAGAGILLYFSEPVTLFKLLAALTLILLVVAPICARVTQGLSAVPHSSTNRHD